MKLMKWYPLLTLPMFIFMGYMLSESRIADDLYRMFHVWMGRPARRPGHRHHRADGADLGHERPVGRRHGHRRHHRAAGAAAARLRQDAWSPASSRPAPRSASSCRPASCWCSTRMIARQPVGQLWLAGVFPGLMMAALFIALHRHPLLAAARASGPPLPKEERDDTAWPRSSRLLRAGLLPLVIFVVDDGPVRQRAGPAWSRARPSARWRPFSPPWSRAG